MLLRKFQPGSMGAPQRDAGPPASSSSSTGVAAGTATERKCGRLAGECCLRSWRCSGARAAGLLMRRRVGYVSGGFIVRQGGPVALEVGGDVVGCGAVGWLVVVACPWCGCLAVGGDARALRLLVVGACGVGCGGIAAGLLGAASTVTCSFSFTGAAQSFTVPSGVNSITVAAFGAQGGGGGGPGGLGGEAQAVFAVSPGAAVEVLVGGQGGTSSGAQAGAPGG